MITFDFKCTKCGHSETDVLLPSSTSPNPECPICNEVMEKLFTGFSTPHGVKSHRQLPSDYQFAKGGANFGRVEDL